MEGSAEVEEMQEAKREGERVAWERERGQLLGEAEVPTHACKRKHSTHARTHARMHACMHARTQAHTTVPKGRAAEDPYATATKLRQVATTNSGPKKRK